VPTTTESDGFLVSYYRAPKKQCIKAGAMLQNGREKMLGNDQAGLPDGIVSNQKYQFEYVNIAVFCNERYW
jgi:hypothetical protein